MSLVGPSMVRIVISDVVESQKVVHHVGTRAPLSVVTYNVMSTNFNMSVMSPFATRECSSSLMVHPLRPPVTVG